MSFWRKQLQLRLRSKLSRWRLWRTSVYVLVVDFKDTAEESKELTNWEFFKLFFCCKVEEFFVLPFLCLEGIYLKESKMYWKIFNSNFENVFIKEMTNSCALCEETIRNFWINSKRWNFGWFVTWFGNILNETNGIFKVSKDVFFWIYGILWERCSTY